MLPCRKTVAVVVAVVERTAMEATKQLVVRLLRRQEVVATVEVLTEMALGVVVGFVAVGKLDCLMGKVVEALDPGVYVPFE